MEYSDIMTRVVIRALFNISLDIHITLIHGYKLDWDSKHGYKIFFNDLNFCNVYIHIMQYVKLYNFTH